MINHKIIMLLKKYWSNGLKPLQITLSSVYRAFNLNIINDSERDLISMCILISMYRCVCIFYNTPLHRKKIRRGRVPFSIDDSLTKSGYVSVIGYISGNCIFLLATVYIRGIRTWVNATCRTRWIRKMNERVAELAPIARSEVWVNRVARLSACGDSKSTRNSASMCVHRRAGGRITIS